MSPQEVQENMRRRLASIGLTPTAQGEQVACESKRESRRILRAAVDKLQENDLFILALVASVLTWEA